MKSSRLIEARINETRDFRSASSRMQTLKLADTPWLFGEIRQPDTQMLVIPKVSSERRKYIPIAFVQSDIIINGSALIVPNATFYEFGILISSVHNAWMRAVAGRMKSDYQYSGSIVYNNFPWSNPTDEQKTTIETTARAILEARDKYANETLANLYDETFMPIELRRAHRANDEAVLAAYGWPKNLQESEIVARLFEMYEAIIKRK